MNNLLNENAVRDSGRNHVVDIAKGITMLLVIWVHVDNNIPIPEKFATVSHFIGCMCMPCFFIISGFFMKDESFSSFIKKKIKNLLWPFLFVYFLSYWVAFVINSFHPGLLKNDLNILNALYSHVFTNGPIWFLSSLFVALFVVFF